MEDIVTYNDIMSLSPEEKEQFSRYANAKLSKLACECTETMKIRGSSDLCLEHRIEYWDAQADRAIAMVELLKDKRDAVQPPDTKDN